MISLAIMTLLRDTYIISYIQTISVWDTTVELVYCARCAKVLNFSIKNQQIWLRNWFERYSRKSFHFSVIGIPTWINFNFHLFFSLPKMKVLPFEHQDLKVYDKAHRKGKMNDDCGSSYSECNFSLIELALGEYSLPYSYMWMGKKILHGKSSFSFIQSHGIWRR